MRCAMTPPGICRQSALDLPQSQLLRLGLTAQEKTDVVEYLKSLPDN